MHFFVQQKKILQYFVSRLNSKLKKCLKTTWVDSKLRGTKRTYSFTTASKRYQNIIAFRTDFKMALFFWIVIRGLVLQLLLNGQVTTFHLTHECHRIIHCHFMCEL